MPCLDSLLGYPTGNFQALKLIAVFDVSCMLIYVLEI